MAHCRSLSLAVGSAGEVAGGLVLLLLLLQIVSDLNNVDIRNTEHTLSTWSFKSVWRVIAVMEKQWFAKICPSPNSLHA